MASLVFVSIKNKCLPLLVQEGELFVRRQGTLGTLGTMALVDDMDDMDMDKK